MAEDLNLSFLGDVGVEDFTVECGDGMTIAAQRWSSKMRMSRGTSSSPSSFNDSNGQRRKRRILCIHGFLDNCRSFWYLAPYLISNLTDEDPEIVCLDLPGHGESSHFGSDHPITCSTEYLHSILQVMLHLQQEPHSSEDERFTIIGHSMGAHLSLMVAASFPELVESVILLDGLGPDVAQPKDCSKVLRRHLESRRRISEQNKPVKVYPSLEAAVATRQRTAQLAPGKQWISNAAATELVKRALVERSEEGGVSFRHDPRIQQLKQLYYLTMDHVESLLRDLSCPLYFLAAIDGWPGMYDWMEAYRSTIAPELAKKLPGSHHFHADPETAQEVAETILKILLQENKIEGSNAF